MKHFFLIHSLFCGAYALMFGSYTRLQTAQLGVDVVVQIRNIVVDLPSLGYISFSLFSNIEQMASIARLVFS